MISYCVCVYRPRLFYILLDDLIRKTGVPYEILVWLNTRAPELEAYIERLALRGVPVKVVGSSPENVGMVGYKMLFLNAKYDMIAQVHDDVICISRNIAKKAAAIFKKHGKVKQIVADVIQDSFTTGGRPGDDSYIQVYEEERLFSGPIDGWFSIYHRSILPIVVEAPYAPYFYLGSYVQMQLAASKKEGLLCKAMKVLHLAGPAYSQLFETVESEARKYMGLGNKEAADRYLNMKPSPELLDQMCQQYKKNVEIIEEFGSDES